MTVHELARWRLTLYVSGASPQSTSAVETVRRICDEELLGNVDLQIVDVHDPDSRAEDDGIIVVPTLVRRLPEPCRKVVGDLSDIRWVRTALDLPAATCEDTDQEAQ